MPLADARAAHERIERASTSERWCWCHEADAPDAVRTPPRAARAPAGVPRARAAQRGGRRAHPRRLARDRRRRLPGHRRALVGGLPLQRLDDPGRHGPGGRPHRPPAAKGVRLGLRALQRRRAARQRRRAARPGAAPRPAPLPPRQDDAGAGPRRRTGVSPADGGATIILVLSMSTTRRDPERVVLSARTRRAAGGASMGRPRCVGRLCYPATREHPSAPDAPPHVRRLVRRRRRAGAPRPRHLHPLRPVPDRVPDLPHAQDRARLAARAHLPDARPRRGPHRAQRSAGGAPRPLPRLPRVRDRVPGGRALLRACSRPRAARSSAGCGRQRRRGCWARGCCARCSPTASACTWPPTCCA